MSRPVIFHAQEFSLEIYFSAWTGMPYSISDELIFRPVIFFSNLCGLTSTNSVLKVNCATVITVLGYIYCLHVSDCYITKNWIVTALAGET